MAEFEFVNATELMDQIKGMRREYERLVECTANTDVGRIQRRYYLERADALDDVIRTIQMLQRHDAVEITRCRNCVYGPETAAQPGEREVYANAAKSVNPDDFYISRCFAYQAARAESLLMNFLKYLKAQTTIARCPNCGAKMDGGAEK